MRTTISSKSDSIQVAYNNYVKGKYIVNRNYQRKLVWTQEEKKAFIDSVYNHYSVPLVLVADKSDNQSQMYEIIDGMQRLNAIFSFIENEFPISINGVNVYFDLDTLADTIERRNKKIIQQKKPVLDRNVCLDIVSYQLPISYITAEETDIEEIFRRINSYGRQLSNQEIRQAGALGVFPTMVRKIASQIRGDVSTTDLIGLDRMKNISLSNVNLPYGIRMEDVFWVKQKVITTLRMRTSRDEELIAWLLAYIILGDKVAPTAKSLDRLYQYQDAEGKILAKSIEDKIMLLGEKNIQQWFMNVFSTIKNVIESTGKDFRTFIYSEDDGEGLVRTFQVIYLAFYNLIINDKMSISNQNLLKNKLNGIGRTHLQGIKKSDNWSAKYRQEKILSVEAIIKCAFKKNSGGNVAYENWAMQLDNLLHLSTTEGNQYDYKVGFHTMKKDKDSFNAKLIRKCIEVLTAEVNKCGNTTGYVIIGVAESEETLKTFKTFYNKTDFYAPVANTTFYVTGVEDEIKMYYEGEGDKYVRAIKAEIEKCPIDDRYKIIIQQNMKMVNYNGHTVLILELKSDTKPIFFDKKIYVRKGTDTVFLEDAQTIVEYVQHFND